MRPLRSLERCIVGLVTLLVAHQATAEVIAVAPLGALGVDPGEARAVERRVRVVAAKLPGVRLLPRERLAKRLRDPRKYGCADRPACIGPLARRAGAKAVITGDVGGIAGAHVVHLKLVAGSGVVIRAVSGVLQQAQRARAVRETLVRLMSPARHSGSLQVETDVEGAWIYLDGRRVARGRKALLERVPAGTHALRITHEAYQDYVRFVRVDFERRAFVRAPLSAYLAQHEEMRLREKDEPLTSAELPWYRRWWVVAGFGAVVVAAAATTVALIPKSASADGEATVGVPPAP